MGRGGRWHVGQKMAMDNIVLTGGARMLQQARTVRYIADARIARACVALRAYHATF